MNRLLGCAASLYLLSATMPRAAELPIPASSPEWSWDRHVQAYDWTGPYVGINAGGVLGVSRQTEALAPTSTGDFNLTGGLVGGTAGFRVQLGQTVFGIDGDIDWIHSRGSTTCRAGAFVCSTATDFLATGRAVVGYTLQNNFLGYVTGGAAIGDINQSFSPALAGSSGTTNNRVGWTAGAGVEYALWTASSSSWSIKFEYLYVNFGTFSCTVACSGVPGQITNVDLRENIFRAGINFRY